MKYSILFAAGASAYPFAMEMVGSAMPDFAPLHKRTNEELMDLESLTKRAGLSPLAVSQQETNCGPAPCLTFDAASQYVSNKGDHAYQKPAPGSVRGPCPGLNAAANHGYLDRSGIQTIQSTVTGLGEAYSFEPAFAAALAVFSSVISGDILTERWSIGGPMPYTNLGGLLAQPEGISYSHNRYEGDVSIGRNDAYLGHGDAHSLNATRWAYANSHCTQDRCTLDKFRQAFLGNVYQSIDNNPYYFSPFLAGAVVPPAAYNFVINFMSNHSAAEPSGYLNTAMFAQFFAIDNSNPAKPKWIPGNEQIPNNWYKRPSAHPYGAAQLVADDVIGWAARPASFRLGGNTNGVKSYRGVDISLLTGGAYKNPAALLQGNNAACLLFQSMSQVSSDELRGASAAVMSAADALIGQYITPLTSGLGCPQIAFDQDVFNPYPGSKYNPTAVNS